MSYMHKIHKNEQFFTITVLEYWTTWTTHTFLVFHDIALLLGLGLGNEAPRSGAERHQASEASRRS